MVKLSVIIPAYNVGNYIARCLDSIINQTFRDMEILIIDDKSTDNTLSVIQEYVKKDSRIKVFCLEKNSGVSVARNKGLDESGGEYIGFIDPDDYIDLDFYEKLYSKAILGNADIVAGNIREFMRDGKVRVCDELLDNINRSKFNFTYTMWMAIYKFEFIKENKLYCPVGVRHSEDSVFVRKCACLCNKIDVVYDTYYNYIRVGNSLDSDILSENALLSIMESVNHILNFVNVQDISEENYNILLLEKFCFLSQYSFFRNTKHSTRMMVMNGVIDIYKKYKYKSFIKNNYYDMYILLESEDAEGLYEFNENFMRSKMLIKKIKLFGCITLFKLKIYTKDKKLKIYLFGIPILAIK